jgi:hypothetical protein
MQCPFCNANISAAARYCPHCGKKVDVTFDEISSGMVRQETSDKLQEKVRESRRVLGIAVFFFVLLFIVYIAIPSPPVPEVVPVYRAEVPAIYGADVMQPEMPLLEIPK